MGLGAGGAARCLRCAGGAYRRGGGRGDPAVLIRPDPSGPGAVSGRLTGCLAFAWHLGRATAQNGGCCMSFHRVPDPAPDAGPEADGQARAYDTGFMTSYLETLMLVERLHRLLLDVIKDEFERVGILEVNAVQALLMFNVGDNEVTAGELKTRGYYQGSNVSYNLKKLMEMGYMHHQRCEIDRRSVAGAADSAGARGARCRRRPV